MRDYQEDCMDAMFRAYDRGVRTMLVVLSTGLGKTATIAEFARRFNIGPEGQYSGIFCAHRDVLLRQAWKTFRRQIPSLSLGAEKGGHASRSTHDLVFASIASLREERLLALGVRFSTKLRLLIIDEAHRSLSPLYRELVAFVREAFPNCLIVGLTATPRRTDKQSLGEIYEEVVFERDLIWAIRNGYLVPLIGSRFFTDVSLENVKVGKDGDFNERQLEKALDVESRNLVVAQGIAQSGAGKHGIAFAPGVKNAQRVCELVRRMGVRAGVVWGDMSKEERNWNFDAHRARELDHLISADLLIEGYDDDGIDIVFWSRKTLSWIVWSQGNGRGTRPHASVAKLLGPGSTVESRLAAIADSPKPHTHICDFVDAAGTHRLQSFPSLFYDPTDRPKQLDLRGVADVGRGYVAQEREDLLGPAPAPANAEAARASVVTVGAGEAVGEASPETSDRSEDDEGRPLPTPDELAGMVRLGETITSSFDPLRAQAQMRDVADSEAARFRWVFVGNGVWRILFPPSERAVDAQGKSVEGWARILGSALRETSNKQEAQQRSLLQIGAVRIEKTPLSARIEPIGESMWRGSVCEDTETTDLGTFMSAGGAVAGVEAWIRSRYPGLAARFGKRARWRSQVPDEALRKALLSRGLTVPATGGEAYDLLEEAIAREERERSPFGSGAEAAFG
jgi:superfamily II DNA or RNA helicase